ncbi:zinc finger FYVE-type containing 26 spastizin [Lasioglossum baleicum]|uniref:zinc finger FYVE-type containing 26 spastizin n=1 Tax=Lasioglossum baleicum TaxID=434251 RepID=UPI003FCE164F
MSEFAEVFEINKCVLSKLWYTSLVLYQETNSDKYLCCQSDTVDFVKSESLTENSISARNKSQQWIIQILLQKLIGNVTSDIRNVKNYHDYMQMLQALQLCQNMTVCIQQKLLTIYESDLKQADSEVLKILYEECFTFFKQNIYNNPTIVCWIINKLLSLYFDVSSTIFHNLQDFYVSLVNELLGSELTKQQSIDNLLGCALCILSRMNISESNRIEWFKLCFPTLLKACNIQDIELALYSRIERKPFNAWRTFFNETCAHSRIIKNLDDALKIQEVLFDYTSTVVPAVNKNNLVERVINTKLHWATDILDICYILMTNRKYDNVSSILSSKIFQNFWPVLLFKALNNCENEEIISNGSREHEIIKYLRLKCDPDRFYDSILQECNVALKKCNTVVEYIMNQRNDVCGINNDNQNIEPVKQRISVQQIFKLLLHFNSLSVLKMTTNIHEQQYNAIENLLKDLSEPEDTLYAYCSMLSALKALLLCDTYDINQSVITSHFTDMKYYVQIVYPLNLRIDVIKNIFSLLFLRHEHFDYSQKNYDNSNTSTSNGQTNFGNKQSEESSTGFLCNKYAIRDMLFHLKEILSAMEIELTKMKNENRCAETDQVQKDISSIDAAIMDAKWRLELYTNSQFVESIDIYKDANRHVHVKHKVLMDGKLILNRFKEIVFSYQKGSTSDDRRIRSDSSSESEPIHNSTRRKKRKNTLQAIDETTNKDTAHKPSFVNFMLATKESLVVQCLWESDYIKANDIIEASDMKNTQLSGELQFSKALCMFRENVCKQANSLQDKDSFKENLQSSTLENLRQVAQEGILSSRQTSQLETFLASQEMNLRLLSMDILSSNEIFAICALDMALTMSQTYSVSSNLCDVAMKYLRLCKTFDNTEYEYFFPKIYQLLHEKKEELSVENILCDAKILLSMKESKAREDIWTDIAMKHQKLKESQTNKHTINKILKDSNYLPGLKILSEAAVIPNDTEKYIQIIYSHIKLLHTIIPTDHQILTVSELLKTPLHYYFGYQIFDCRIEPDKLERIAYSLRVNLVYSILTNACPIVLHEQSIKKPMKNKGNGCIILNKELSQSDLNRNIQGPNECVSEILTELLEILQSMNVDQFSLSDDVCETISKHPDIRNVLSKTSRLARLDLSELSMGDETLTFLLNTWNLMFLHASLIIWADHPAFNNLQQAVSSMSIGYLIGDLGLVTLAALRSKLLNNIMLSNKFFMELEELNEPIWQDLDITHDPKVIFIMASEFYGTPRIRVCDPKSINESLKEAFQEYLYYYSSRFEESEENTEKKIILLPDIVQQYQNLQDIDDSEDVLSIDDYFKHSGKNVIIQYIPPSNSYNVILKYKSLSYTHNEKEPNLDKSMQKSDNIRPSLLQYLESYCWVVSYLLQRIYNENPTILENSCDNLKRTACLENLLSSSWVKDMKSLFENNETLAAILEIIPRQKLWSHFEETLKENEWHDCLKVLNALPDNLIASTELQYFKDKILSYIVSKEDTKILQYVYQIKDIYILSQTVLYNVKKWNVNVSVNALLHSVHHVDTYKLPAPCKLQLKEILHRVLIFHRMLPYCTVHLDSIFYNVAYCTDEIDQFHVIRSLISADKFELCLEWLESQAFSLEIDFSVEQDFLIGLLRSESQPFKQTSKFLRSLPLNQSVKLCGTVLKKLNSIDSMQFICNYLLEHCKATKTVEYRKTLIGIEILHMLEIEERPLHIHLIKEPLLMLEQLLMNCKFESVQKILNKITDRLAQVDISRDDFDKIIRFYAQKSLDCRVSLQCDTVDSKSKRVQYLETESNEFVMPIVVPTKEEWVPNDKARKCSCCKTVIFSMFNRRHHCRRCGRVICAQCSQHRMQVSGYPPSVLVRVCDDCKRLTVLQTRALQGTPSSASSETFDCWKLTRDEKHNESIREEFSFEYAPNISLCLAILNLHSDHETYTSFLLDRCDEMKRLLQPVTGGNVNPEVDHIVIIRMIRSLLVAAKVKCAKLGFNAGLVHCDRFLSQIDLIASLVNFDCLHYIPSDNLDGKALKKLRDLLIEKEQWILALDVSTKAGLDTQGVWVTWGKTCLKVGYFDEAREKFSHCLDKIQHEEFDDWVFLSYPKDSMTEIRRDQRSISENKINEGIEITMDELSVRKTEISKNRPLKDPPLLTEIQQILENLSTYKQYVQYPHQCKSNAAQEISIVFGYLKVANQGQTTLKNVFLSMQQIYYYETLYYLLMYGSLNSIIEFFLKHDQFDECLTFTLENDLEPDLFFNGIYLYCLKNGNTEKLHEAMKNKDSILLIWKKYLIHVCYSLERRQYLHILYQLQLFMKDFIRAAMTCIRFYRNDISNYSDLCAKGHYLLDAREHLESELQIENLNRKRKKSTSSMHSNHGILTMEMEPPEIDKHINTISRQMEIAKFLATCEKEGRTPVQFLNLFPGKDSDNDKATEVPTLFGNQQQKIDLAVLAILCGCNIEEGFGIAFRIIQDYNLPQQKVYSLAGHILTLKCDIPGIEQLIKCCHSSGISNSYIIADYVLTHCVQLLLNRSHGGAEAAVKNDVHSLIKLITDIELKINAYIECKHLKTAYLLAVNHSRAQDIRKILKESDRLGQTAIKAICIKWLQQESKS